MDDNGKYKTVLGPLFCRNSLFTSTLMIGVFQLAFATVSLISGVTQSYWLSAYSIIFPPFHGADLVYDSIACVAWFTATILLLVGLCKSRRPTLFVPTLIVQPMQIFASFCNVAVLIYLYTTYPKARPLSITPEQFSVDRRLTFSIYGVKLFMNTAVVCFAVICFRLMLVAYNCSNQIRIPQRKSKNQKVANIDNNNEPCTVGAYTTENGIRIEIENTTTM